MKLKEESRSAFVTFVLICILNIAADIVSTRVLGRPLIASPVENILVVGLVFFVSYLPEAFGRLRDDVDTNANALLDAMGYWDDDDDDKCDDPDCPDCHPTEK